jgi:hypothetical protein
LDGFNPIAGEQGKRDGVARAARGANPEWKRIMQICALAVARRKPYFTTDDVEYWQRAYYPNHTTREKRAMGPVMLDAARHGYCKTTTDFCKSSLASCNQRPKQVWWSLVYGGPLRFRLTRRKPLDPRRFELFTEDEKASSR